VARRPSVFVRPLSMEEGQKLQRIMRTDEDPVGLRRAIVVTMFGQGLLVEPDAPGAADDGGAVIASTRPHGNSPRQTAADLRSGSPSAPLQPLVVQPAGRDRRR
jgi:hypothetical protein